MEVGTIRTQLSRLPGPHGCDLEGDLVFVHGVEQVAIRRGACDRWCGRTTPLSNRCSKGLISSTPHPPSRLTSMTPWTPSHRPGDQRADAEPDTEGDG
jgi:hypothetical protein